MKPPCNTADDINEPSNICFKGTPWVDDHLLETWLPNPMSWNKNISVENNDNTHGASEVLPYHHPLIEGTCDADVTGICSIMQVSNTQVNWPKFSDTKIQKN